LVTDSHSILARWKNNFSQLFIVHGINGVRQTAVPKAKPLVPEPSAYEVEMAIEKLKRHKSPGIDQIPVELIKAGGRTICSEIHKLINSIGKEELPEEWKESIIVPIYKKGNKTNCSNYRGISLLSTTYKILSNILLSRLRKLLGIISVNLHATGQLLIMYSAFVKHMRKNGKTMNHCISYFIDFKKAYDSFRREVLCNVLIEFDIPMKLVRLIKVCLNETYS
jgi:hypothetical protein